MTSEMKSDERRCSKRVCHRYHARLFPLSLETKNEVFGIQEVTGRDIGEGGLQVCSDRIFAVRSRLLVEMDSTEIPEGFQAVGSVAWISPSASRGQWCLGIEFSDVGDLALSGIRGILGQERSPS